MQELKETQKFKVVQLHEKTPKQFLDPTPAPKITRQGPKSKKQPQNKVKIKSQNFRNYQNKSYSTTQEKPKTVF